MVSTWGDILRRLDEKAGMLCSDIDFEKISEVRKQLPLLPRCAGISTPCRNVGRIIFIEYWDT